MRVYYTTYDVRRDEDVIHPGTAHCNVMVLNPTVSPSEHPFWYARVLGIFHANVIYTGEDVGDFQPRRLEFLWVRWYQVDDSSTSWTSGTLDRVNFPPMMNEDAFGFIDPTDVIRSSHIVPAFSQGKVHLDGIGMSHSAKDSNDWKRYYIMRCVSVGYISVRYLIPCLSFVDRDMVMRYHWGLGVGHTYAHRKTTVPVDKDDTADDNRQVESDSDDENMYEPAKSVDEDPSGDETSSENEWEEAGLDTESSSRSSCGTMDVIYNDLEAYVDY